MTRTIAYILALGFFAALLATIAHAHAPYELACCKGTDEGGDCAPTGDEDVEVRPDGFWIKSYRMLIRRDDQRIRASFDEHYHLCGHPEWSVPVLYCIYVPGGGV